MASERRAVGRRNRRSVVSRGLRGFALSWGLLAACGEAPPAPEAAEVALGWTDDERAVLLSMRALSVLPPDPSNRFADDPAAAALGRRLFYDPGLSPSGSFSCATCHAPELHFTDGRALSQAAGTTARHAPTVEGAQLGPWFFWDGRVDSLWAQAAGPVENPAEMASDRVFVVRTVIKRYDAASLATVGIAADPSWVASLPVHARPDAARPDAAHAVAWAAMSEADQRAVTDTFVRVLKAIAAFERTVLPGVSAFDRYLDGLKSGDASGGGALSEPELAGLRFFVRDGNCVSCHHGPMLSDHAFHNLGLPIAGVFDGGRTGGAEAVASAELRCGTAWSDAKDCEELKYLNPAFPDFIAAFKTPTLRNVMHTAPYMHHGGLATLDDVLSFYSDLPGEPGSGHRELTLRPLQLRTEQREALKAFLGALSAPVAPAALKPAG